MKITLISFDYFDFDANIIKELKSRGIEAHHIDISKYYYQYASFGEKVSNFFRKVFLGKNIKREKTEEFITQHLSQYGHQDIILTIRPDRISKKTHLKIKQSCNKYLTYIYDSTNRFPINHLVDLFDKIYTFDQNDAKKHGFEHISNYIYLDKKELNPNKVYRNDLFIISSIDERLGLLNKVADYCSNHNITFKFIIVGKKRPQNINSNIEFTTENIFLNDLLEELDESKIFLDLIRKNQNGLSFRIFEALAYQKKIITSNQSIKDYDFYSPNNILVLDENNPIIPKEFIESNYEPLSEEVYNKYTIQVWVDRVFELKN